MEFGERKRRRKSQSFKLVTDEGRLLDECKDLVRRASVSGCLSGAVLVWLGDEGMEIKRQITGMMRLLSDKSSRVYQRVATEQESLTKEPQDRRLAWVHQPVPLSLVSEDHQSNNWNSTGDPGPSPSSISTPIPNGPRCGQLFCSPCCMCNCKGTLQAILQELRAMRRIMQTQKGQRTNFHRQEQTVSPCQPRLSPGPAPRRRPRKRRPIYKVAPLTVSSARRAALTPPEASPLIVAPAESEETEESEKEQHSSTASTHPNSSEITMLPPQNNPSEVRLAEDYDVFISKAQLDSILVNYTRSGSLLFRKLVCAFFDDATLANSLPNGKRKRGLNDNRKGLDQNIVGAIKVFTEKYCTEHRIEKLPGPRDWVQILQDQIKLARRRLKRGNILQWSHLLSKF
uniref:Si:ch211-220f12.4 n=1 Tax=Echeneis naucrates TaxID=173247 RepID=A0A665UC77_ECHNA